MIKVWSTYPPVIYTNPITGVTQLAGGTISKLEVDGTQVDPATPVPDMLDLGWFNWMAPNRPAAVRKETKTVAGSNGKVYTLERQPSGKWTCTCPGYQYRRFCKHTGAK
jgi:hypothetical protein